MAAKVLENQAYLSGGLAAQDGFQFTKEITLLILEVFRTSYTTPY